MLDNEPTTEAAGTAAPAQSAATRKTAKTAAAKKTTTTRKRAAKKTAEPAAEAAVPAKKTAAKATAKKAPAKKAAAAPAKKAAAAKKTAKRTTKKAASQDTFPELFAPAAESAEAEPAPAKKTTRKRTTKKAAATPATDASAPTDSAPADASANAGSGEHANTSGAEAPAAKRNSRRRTSKSAAASDAQTTAPDAQAAAQAAPEASVSAEAEAPSARRTRRRPAASAAVLFQAPTADTKADEPATAKATQPKATQPSRQPAQAETAPAEAAAPEPGADEQPTGTRRRRSRRGRDAEARDTAPEPTTDDAPTTVSADPAAETEAKPEGRSSRRTRTRKNAEAAAKSDDTDDDTTDTDTDAEAADGSADGQGEDGEEGTRRRRRRRGGRRRRKSGDADGADDSADEQSDDDQDDESEQDTDAPAADADSEADAEADTDEDGEAGGSSTRRRRRRRRRKGEDSVASPDDPDETVVRVREPRSKNSANEVTAIEGSTRLEAKKQRRREGRAAGRRRAPIVTEAEFLARREAVDRTMVIRSREDVTQIAVSEDNVLVEHYVTTAEQTSLIGNVYLGRVQNVLPSMEAAFIDIGKGRNAVLYAGEVDWATLGGSNGPRKIEQVLKSGQAVLVQVTKDPIGHKGARLTNQISLPGRYVVYVPRGGNGGISRKLPDTERNRLKTILKDIVPDEAGVIVRTAAEGASEEELTSDVSRLQAAWEEIDKKSKNGQSPQLLYGEPDLLIRVVRDLFTEDFAKLVVSGDHAYDQVREYVDGVAPHLVDRLEKAQSDVFSDYRIDEQIKKALDRKVWLPSGGSLVIDRTEAMTVVDVNTGKFTGSGGNLEETVTKNNLEAAEEIVRQLRLRDIGGIIVIDFIDMVLESNRDLVLRRLVECLGRDRTKHQVAEVTSLGLVQMTRKRIGTGLLEAFSENCDHCGGRGLILHDEPKESRRRDGRNGQNGQNGQHSGNSQEQKPAQQSEDGGRKSSRRRRGKGRGEDEQTTEPEAQHNGDAAQKLAQIAAASSKTDEQTDGTPEPTGYPVSAGADEHVSPEATGFPAAETAEAPAAEAAEATDAAQNGAPKSTRRRRSSRSRSKTATDSETTEPSELVTTGS